VATYPAKRNLDLNARRSPIVLRIGFWICIVISIGVVLRRIVALASSTRSGPPQMVALDDTFASHAALTLAHIIPALIFVLLAPFLVLRRVSAPGWVHRAFYPLGAIVGLTAYAMSIYSVGGWTERSAVLFFDSFFLYSLARAFLFHQKHDAEPERRWQLRSIAILLGIATTRPVMGVFFATSRLTHLVPQQFFGIAFWIGFSINVAIFELWIRGAERRRHRSSSPPEMRRAL
jgi:hypothetical protein